MKMVQRRDGLWGREGTLRRKRATGGGPTATLGTGGKAGAPPPPALSPPPHHHRHVEPQRAPQDFPSGSQVTEDRHPGKYTRTPFHLFLLRLPHQPSTVQQWSTGRHPPQFEGHFPSLLVLSLGANLAFLGLHLLFGQMAVTTEPISLDRLAHSRRLLFPLSRSPQSRCQFGPARGRRSGVSFSWYNCSVALTFF